MTTTLAPERVGLPPPRATPPPPTARPTLHLDLVDDGRRVGSITGDIVRYRGFADATEAMQAAWVAYRTLARRLARTHDIRALPIDIARLTLYRTGDRELVLADGRVIATLVRPQDGDDSYAIDIEVPAPADQLRVRAMADLMYRTLRRAGLRWKVWRPGTRPQPVAREESDVRTSLSAARRSAAARAWHPLAPRRARRLAGAHA